MHEGFSPQRTITLVVISLATVVAVYCGWRLFWFLTDDAFIAFRYISNAHLGYGYVWNAPPFRPVEGYTSFLWVVLLDAVWRVSGVEPPVSANWISLLFTYPTLLLGGLMVMKLKLRGWMAKYRLVFLCLVLVGVVTNRTFLAWTSSGLETALFNFLLTLWIYCCLFVENSGRRWMFWLSLTTALLCLARPDGLLFAMATGALLAKALWDAKKAMPLSGVFRLALGATPLLIIPAHILWRHAFYGAWLPNTYYAKTIRGRIWPESGLRYMASFGLEYALWIWALLLLVALVVWLRRIRSFKDLRQISHSTTVVCLTVIAHVLYYTIIVGGDHFEYRVYSQLILLLFITFLWLLNALRLRTKWAVLLFSFFIVFSWPVPWLHWSASHNRNDRRRTAVMGVSVARAFQRRMSWTPRVLLNYLRSFDKLQSWLIGHSVCMRHQEHKVFYRYLTETLPSRTEGFSLPSADYPVSTASSVGVISWVLPKVNIIDALGLNDYVVARNSDLNLPIQMAHERRPPTGYMECFSPNVALEQGRFIITRRPEKMTADKIMRCEQEYAVLVENPRALERVPLPVPNPIDDPRFFVRQQYLDVLDREPDPSGLAYWSDHLVPCPTDTPCFNDGRIKIPVAFIDPSEFQETALFVYRLHAVSFGTIPLFSDFLRDRKWLSSHGIDWREPDDALPVHRSFIDDWMQRDSFQTLYPEAMTPEEFVNELFERGNLTQFALERDSLIKALRVGKTRADVLSQIIENEELKRKVDEQSVVPMQLLMLLRHDVDKDGPYRTWLDKLQRHEPVDAQHVICLILTSDEYQRRFGTVITHSNAECH